jgi:AAA domain
MNAPARKKGSFRANGGEPKTEDKYSSFARSRMEVNGAVKDDDESLPPHSDAYEIAVITGLVDDLAVAWPILEKAGLTRAHFYDQRLGELFAICGEFHAGKVKKAEIILLVSELKSRGYPGDEHWLSHLTSGHMLAGSVGHYVPKLKTLHAKRQLKKALTWAGQLVDEDNDQDDPAQVLDTLDRVAEAARYYSGNAVPDYESRRFDPNKTPPPLRPVFQIGDVPISTPGNITSIASAVKVGKSGFVDAMLAATMTSRVAESDTLGISSENPAGRAVVHIDSEQSPDDHWRLVDRASRRARVSPPPDWLRSYCFTGLDAAAALGAFKACLKRAASECGGIHSVFLDGFADFVRDVNDPGECNPFVAELHGLAVEFDCPIIGVIHFNPGSDKTRGHLGSQIERKSETNLTLEKVDGVTKVWSTKQRRAPIPKGTGPKFTWSDEAGMHVSVESGCAAKDALAIQQELPIRFEVFSERPAMRHSELLDRVQIVIKKSESTAKRKISEWVRLGIIEASLAGLYAPKGYK